MENNIVSLTKYLFGREEGANQQRKLHLEARKHKVGVNIAKSQTELEVWGGN